MNAVQQAHRILFLLALAHGLVIEAGTLLIRQLARLFPVGALNGVHLVFLGDLLDRFDAIVRIQGYTGFEFWIVSAAFGFHLRWFLGFR
jgi:hypothetical protein